MSRAIVELEPVSGASASRAVIRLRLRKRHRLGTGATINVPVRKLKKILRRRERVTCELLLPEQWSVLRQADREGLEGRYRW